MLSKNSLTLIVILLLGACASKETFNTAKEINEECNIELQAAITAVRLRNKGKPKTFLQNSLAPITADSSRLLINLHEIVTETFQYPALNEVVYPTYRFELCMRQLQRRPYPIAFAIIEPPLLVCQQQFGMTSTNASTQCIIHAIEHLEPHQLTDPNQATVTVTEPTNETNP